MSTENGKSNSPTFVAAGHPLDLARVADLSSNHVREHAHLQWWTDQSGTTTINGQCIRLKIIIIIIIIKFFHKSCQTQLNMVHNG